MNTTETNPIAIVAFDAGYSAVTIQKLLTAKGIVSETLIGGYLMADGELVIETSLLLPTAALDYWVVAEATKGQESRLELSAVYNKPALRRATLVYYETHVGTQDARVDLGFMRQDFTGRSDASLAGEDGGFSRNAAGQTFVAA